MKRDLHELSDRQRIEIQETLNLPVGEFAALIIGALFTLAFLLGPPSLGTELRNAVRTTASAVTSAVADLGDRFEARAAEHRAKP
jgi:hypothetical protein